MGAEIIRAEGLTKSYGEHRGIADVDFSVDAGEVFGFLGPNGAGKTTTIRLLLDLIRPTRGRLSVFGLDSRRDERRDPPAPGLSPRRPAPLRADDRRASSFDYFGHLRGGRVARGDQLAERLDLDLDRPIKELSRGNRQKVGLVQAFIHDPDLLVLDEPTSGLDPLVQRDVPGARPGGHRARRHGVPLLPRAVRGAAGRRPRRAHSRRPARARGHGRESPCPVVHARRGDLLEPPPDDAFTEVPGVREVERQVTSSASRSRARSTRSSRRSPGSTCGRSTCTRPTSRTSSWPCYRGEAPDAP